MFGIDRLKKYVMEAFEDSVMEIVRGMRGDDRNMNSAFLSRHGLHNSPVSFVGIRRGKNGSDFRLTVFS